MFKVNTQGLLRAEAKDAAAGGTNIFEDQKNKTN